MEWLEGISFDVTMYYGHCPCNGMIDIRVRRECPRMSTATAQAHDNAIATNIAHCSHQPGSQRKARKSLVPLLVVALAFNSPGSHCPITIPLLGGAAAVLTKLFKIWGIPTLQCIPD